MKNLARVVLVISLTLLLASTSVLANSRDTYIDRQYVQYCEQIGAIYHVSPEMLEAIIETESSGKANAHNGGCVGLMQVNTSVHQARMRKLGVTNIYDPYSNILVATDLLVELYETYGDDTAMVLMMYNGQSGAKARAEAGQFSDYANKIMDRTRELEEVHGKLSL